MKKNTCRVQRCLWTRHCEARQWWRTVLFLPRWAEAGAAGARLLSLQGAFVALEVMRVSPLSARASGCRCCNVIFSYAFDVRGVISLRKARQLQRSRFLPSRMGCNSKERVVTGRLVQASITRCCKQVGRLFSALTVHVFVLVEEDPWLFRHQCSRRYHVGQASNGEACLAGGATSPRR